MCAMSRCHSATDDLPDQWSPTLVKELRQGLRARAFVAPFFGLQTAALVLTLLIHTAPGAGGLLRQDAVFWLLVHAAVALVLPLRGLGSLAGEQSAGSLPLVVMTGLSRWEIAAGKWLTHLMLGGLMLVSLLPHAVLRYFLGGVELLPSAVLALAVVAASCANGALVLGASGFRSPAIRGLIVTGAYVVTTGATIFLGVAGWLLEQAPSSGWQGRLLVSALAAFGTVPLLQLLIFLTLCGLQLVRCHLRAAIRPWELPGSPPILLLAALGPFMISLASAATAGVGGWLTGAGLIIWVLMLEPEELHRPPTFLHPAPNAARRTPPESR